MSLDDGTPLAHNYTHNSYHLTIFGSRCSACVPGLSAKVTAWYHPRRMSANIRLRINVVAEVERT